jgi:hypothetical protein
MGEFTYQLDSGTPMKMKDVLVDDYNYMRDPLGHRLSGLA